MPGLTPKLAFCLLASVAAGIAGAAPGLAEPKPLDPGPSVAVRAGPDGASPQIAAKPAPSRTLPRDRPMQPRIVREVRSGCGEACAEWIAAEGMIAPGTAPAFAALLPSLDDRRLPVLIDSGGGSVEDAMAMGRLIRERHLDVAVAETIADCSGCAPGTAQPRSPGAVCASACVLVLAAGTSRVGGLATHVGVHQMREEGVRVVKQRTYKVLWRVVGGVRREVGRQLVSERVVSSTPFTGPASRTTDDRVAGYLGEMGIGPALMPLMLSTPPTKIRWLTPREERDSHLLTASNGGEELLTLQRLTRSPGRKPTLTSAVRASLHGPAVIGTAGPNAAAALSPVPR